MRRVFGIGETVLDIIFKGHQPVAAKPGGSAFNALISLGRMGVPGAFISEVGDDRVGQIIRDFLISNNLSAQYLSQFKTGKSAISLAFLNEQQDAEYTFYKDYPNQRLTWDFPDFSPKDVVLFGSFYGLNPIVRPRVKEFLDKAQRQGALIYYDPNFRSSHLQERDMLLSTIEENFQCSQIVRGSDEDFHNIYQLWEPEAIYKRISRFCPILLITANKSGVFLFTPKVKAQFQAHKLNPVSTIGAGDNFNAGLIYGLLHYDFHGEDLATLDEDSWTKIIQFALDFSAEVCLSYDNYISPKFAQSYKKTNSFNPFKSTNL